LSGITRTNDCSAPASTVRFISSFLILCSRHGHAKTAWEEKEDPHAPRARLRGQRMPCEGALNVFSSFLFLPQLFSVKGTISWCIELLYWAPGKEHLCHTNFYIYRVPEKNLYSLSRRYLWTIGRRRSNTDERNSILIGILMTSERFRVRWRQRGSGYGDVKEVHGTVTSEVHGTVTSDNQAHKTLIITCINDDSIVPSFDCVDSGVSTMETVETKSTGPQVLGGPCAKNIFFSIMKMYSYWVFLPQSVGKIVPQNWWVFGIRWGRGAKAGHHIDILSRSLVTPLCVEEETLTELSWSVLLSWMLVISQ
jgi:hypothetical protein